MSRYSTISLYTVAFIALAGLALVPSIVFSQTYTPIEPLPGTTLPGSTGVTLSSYLEGLFKLLVGLAGVFAVLMIVIGGIQYISGAANPSARSEAKHRITNAIFGLILAMASWLILYIINPNLLGTTTIIPQVGTSNNATGATQSSTVQYCFDATQTATGYTYPDCYTGAVMCETVRGNVVDGRVNGVTTISSACYTVVN